MTVALLLAGYALLLATGGRWLLARAAWPQRAPRLGLVAWQALTASVLVSAAAAGLALAVPIGRVSADVAALLQACVMALQAQYATPGGAAAGATGAVLALAVLGRAGYCLATVTLHAVRERSRQHQVLAVVGRTDPRRGLTVVDTAAPAAYCLPGRRHRVVVSSAALDLLDDDQLAAVLAHERAHLAERHHLVLAWTIGLARAFPRLRLFATAETETARLVELLADDVAARRCDRLALAEALLALAGARTPAAALGAGGSTAALRVRRLLAPHQPLGRARAGLGSLTAAVLLAVPVLLFAAPAVAATQLNYCPAAPAAATAASMVGGR